MRRLLRLGEFDGSGGGGSASVVGATLSAYGPNSKTLVLPTGTLPGDQLIAVFTQLTSDGTWTPPTGFTYIQDYRTVPLGEMRNLYFTGIAGSVAADLTFDLSNERNIQGALIAVRGGTVGPTPIWTGGDGSVANLAIVMPDVATQFCVVHNWEGLPKGTPPGAWTDICPQTGIMAVGLLPGAGGTWTAINADSGYAHSLAFDVIPA